MHIHFIVQVVMGHCVVHKPDLAWFPFQLLLVRLLFGLHLRKFLIKFFPHLRQILQPLRPLRTIILLLKHVPCKLLHFLLVTKPLVLLPSLVFCRHRQLQRLLSKLPFWRCFLYVGIIFFEQMLR